MYFVTFTTLAKISTATELCIITKILQNFYPYSSTIHFFKYQINFINKKWLDIEPFLFFLNTHSHPKQELLAFTNGPGDQGSTQVESYQRLKKWYLMPPCLTLSIISRESRVKWSNPGNGVLPSPTPLGSSYWKGSLWVTLFTTFVGRELQNDKR